MKKVFFTARVTAHQTFEIDVTEEQYEQLLKEDAVSGEKLAEYIENNLSENDIGWGEIENAAGLQCVSIYDVKDLVESDN